MANWYVGSTKYTAVAQWAASHVYAAGSIVRQLAAPAVNGERCFRTALGGTSAGSEPTWVLTAGGSSPTDGTITDWTEVTGQAAYGWTAPHARLGAAFTTGWMAAGDTAFVSNAHAETNGTVSITLTSPGTAAAPCYVLCVSDAATPPTTLATSATISVTSTFNITLGNQYTYWYGITFNCGSGAGLGNFLVTAGAAKFWIRFDSCSIRLPNTNVSSQIRMGINDGLEGASLFEMVNTTVSFANASQTMSIYTPMRWRDTPLAILGTMPTVLFTPPSGASGNAPVRVIGVDLSALTSGKSVVLASAGNYGEYYFQDCKLSATASLTSGSVQNQGSGRITFVNCDSGATNYKYTRQGYQGTETQETTVVRSGGATDGTTPVSRKVVTTANSKLYSPFESEWIVYWNDSIGSPITINVPIVTDNVTTTNADAWTEIEYPKNSTDPMGGYATGRVADMLATPAANGADGSSTWTTTGLGTPVQQTLSATFTPQMAGLVRVRVCVARASTTLYFDPLVLASSGKQFMLGDSGYLNGLPTTGGAQLPIIIGG